MTRRQGFYLVTPRPAQNGQSGYALTVVSAQTVEKTHTPCFAQEVVRSCELPFDKLPSIRCLWPLLGANGWFIAPFVASLPVLSEVEGSNHASAFHLLVQDPHTGLGAKNPLTRPSASCHE